MDVTISPAMCFGGRDLTEPTLDPTGRWLAYAVRAGSARAIVTVDLDADRPLERQLTTSPPPATGRAPGGGCFAWRPDGSGIVYAAVDGGLWHQPVPGGAATCLVPGVEGSAVAGPAVAADGSFVVFERDQAGVWAVPLDGGEPNRLDGGDDEFCLDPAVSPDGRRVAWIAWSPPDMPWDGAALVVADRATGERTRGPSRRRRLAAAALRRRRDPRRRPRRHRLAQRLRWATAPWRPSRSSRPDRRGGRASGPSPSSRRAAASPTPATRRASAGWSSPTCGRGRGRRRPRRPLVAVVARPPARRAAHRRADTDRGRGVRHDDVGADRRRRRAGPGLGRRRPGRARAGAGDGGRRCRAARPVVPQPAPERTAAVLGARRPDEPVGRSSSCPGWRSGSTGAGTCSCPITAGRPATGASTSRRCTDAGASSTSPTPPRCWPGPSSSAPDGRRRRSSSVARPAAWRCSGC